LLVSRCSAGGLSAWVSAIQPATTVGVRAGVQRRAVADQLGASAKVVVCSPSPNGLGRRISFWQFTPHGLVVTVITVALGVPYLWLR
jgi:hypothetical protein